MFMLPDLLFKTSVVPFLIINLIPLVVIINLLEIQNFSARLIILNFIKVCVKNRTMNLRGGFAIAL
jgi:hypothetical protein